MMAAIRAHDLGLSSIAMEKTHFFGGTSAMSGGNMWRPTNRLTFGSSDSPYVNRDDRFVDESTSYNTVGNAMIADYRRTGKNIPCWMIFDVDFRDKYARGGLMPNLIMPDRKLPSNWWDSYIFRADVSRRSRERSISILSGSWRR